MGYEAKSATLKSRRRRRTEKEAADLLDRETSLSPTRRRHALARIRKSRQPVAETRRIIAQAGRDLIAGVGGDEIDFSDVQELRVRLILRDGGIWAPQASLLHRMDRLIATESMTRDQFEQFAATAWRMPQVLPKTKMRAATWCLSGLDGTAKRGSGGA